MNVGPVIAGYRRGSGISIRDMAKIIGISHPTLNRIEQGISCDAETLTKILAWLLNGKATPRPAPSRNAKREMANAASIARLEMRQ